MEERLIEAFCDNYEEKLQSEGGNLEEYHECVGYENALLFVWCDLYGYTYEQIMGEYRNRKWVTSLCEVILHRDKIRVEIMSKKLDDCQKNHWKERKELLMAFTNLMASKLTHEEIDMFCISMLHANKMCQLKKNN